jgi:sterol desaturase/sphingolipid hydroxylase (fatty acid hydroxylase superfamily)
MDRLPWDSMIEFGWWLGPIGVVLVWEALAPRREVRLRSQRWPTSFTLGPLNALLSRLAIVPPVLFAAVVADRGWGLLPWIGAPAAVHVPAAMLVLDLLVYVQHRVLHASRILWSFHRVHHSDPEFDIATAWRFHPGEALTTHATIIAGIAIVGLSPLGVTVYLTLASMMNAFDHANVRIPARVERRIQGVFVTPTMHRRHHSSHPADHGTNFASIFSMWDRLFGSYRGGRDDVVSVGLPEFADPKFVTLPWTLALPVVSGAPPRIAGARQTRSTI